MRGQCVDHLLCIVCLFHTCNEYDVTMCQYDVTMCQYDVTHMSLSPQLWRGRPVGSRYQRDTTHGSRDGGKW